MDKGHTWKRVKKRTWLESVARLCLNNSHYLANNLIKLDGIELLFDKPFFNEFVLKFENREIRDRVIDHLINHGIAFGIPLDRYFTTEDGFDPETGVLVTVTELHTKEMLDEVVNRVKECL